MEGPAQVAFSFLAQKRAPEHFPQRIESVNLRQIGPVGLRHLGSLLANSFEGTVNLSEGRRCRIGRQNRTNEGWDSGRSTRSGRLSHDAIDGSLARVNKRPPHMHHSVLPGTTHEAGSPSRQGLGRSSAGSA